MLLSKAVAMFRGCPGAYEVHMRTGKRACERGAVDVKVQVQVGSIRHALTGACSRVSYLSKGWDFSRTRWCHECWYSDDPPCERPRVSVAFMSKTGG